MDPDVTRPIVPEKVVYRCACGQELELNRSEGGRCDQCDKVISPKLLGHELSLTMTISEATKNLPATPGQNDLDVTVEHRSQRAPGVDQDPNVLVGEVFGHFEIVGAIGHGGMGQVYRALDTSLQRYVAVKLLKSGIGAGGSTRKLTRSSDDEIDKLMREAISQARVTHPNIVTIYYVGKQDGDPFLAMELINGQTLSDRIEQGPLAFDEISKISLQIAEALEFSYELDIIHGDIKPSNVLMQPNGLVKLSDFGMARRASLNQQEAVGGTPNYIAPELLRGEIPSVQSDIYALGVTLYEMSFGALPVKLAGTTIDQWIDVHNASSLSFPTPWPDHIPEDWRGILHGMLAKNPQDRYSSYAELIEDLKKLSPGSLVSARVFPRLIAAAVDLISVITFAILLNVLFEFTSLKSILSQHPFLSFLVNALDFLPIVVFTLVVYFWRHSIGRNMVHIRVVNRYGLTPSSNQMTLRSLFRMQFAWVGIAMTMIDANQGWFALPARTLFFVSLGFLILDLVVMAVYNQRRSLHDLMFGTRVVLDTRTDGGSSRV